MTPTSSVGLIVVVPSAAAGVIAVIARSIRGARSCAQPRGVAIAKPVTSNVKRVVRAPPLDLGGRLRLVPPETWKPSFGACHRSRRHAALAAEAVRSIGWRRSK